MKVKIAATFIGVAIGFFVVAAVGKPYSPFVGGSFATAAKRVMPSVVLVSSLVPDETSQNSDWFLENKNLPIPDFFQRSFKVNAHGSGVIIDKRGHILTNHHVIAKAVIVTVKLDGADKGVEAKIVGVDPLTDLALIKIPHTRGLVPARFADSASVLVGQRVAAIGHPFNLNGSFTVGVISGLHRSGLGVVDIEDFMQTDARIFPGNSGGPLLNMQGEVVGINIAIVKEAIGVGFAIPSSDALRVAMMLLKNGSALRGDLGIQTVTLTNEMNAALKISDETKGLLVSQITQGASAWRGGLRAGDVIVAFGGLLVETPMELKRLVVSARKGDEKEIIITRDGKSRKIIVTLDAM